MAGGRLPSSPGCPGGDRLCCRRNRGPFGLLRPRGASPVSYWHAHCCFTTRKCRRKPRCGDDVPARRCAEPADGSRPRGQLTRGDGRGGACIVPLVLLVVCVQAACASAGTGSKFVAARCVARVVRAAAPPGSKGQSDEFGPRRALGSVDIDGRGVQHELGSFGPFVFLEDALLPRGKMPPFNKHPHAGLLSLTLLLRGDYVQPWDNICGESATLYPDGIYVVDSASGIVHSEDKVVRNPADTSPATHAIFMWLDPGVFIRDERSLLASARVFLPAQIPAVKEQGGMTVRVLLGRYLEYTSPAGQLHSKVDVVECLLTPGASEQVVHVPQAKTMAFVFVPRFGGTGLFGATKVRVSELDAAVLTPDGSFLTVLNQEPDKPLRFLLAMAPAGAGIAGGADGGGDLRGGCEPAALFGHNGAVIAPTAEGARERMRQYEEQGERFGDLFAQIPSVSELNMGPFVPERLDLRGIPGFGDDEEGALGQQGLGAVSPAEESHASASPTPPSSPQPESNV